MKIKVSDLQQVVAELVRAGVTDVEPSILNDGSLRLRETVTLNNTDSIYEATMFTDGSARKLTLNTLTRGTIL